MEQVPRVVEKRLESVTETITDLEEREKDQSGKRPHIHTRPHLAHLL